MSLEPSPAKIRRQVNVTIFYLVQLLRLLKNGPAALKLAP